MAVLESHHFHHHMWCFAMNLFDKRVMRRIVLEEEEDEYLERKRQGHSFTNGSVPSASFGDDSDGAMDDED
jgi:hypothetical protein